jgi:hypothetical protein
MASNSALDKNRIQGFGSSGKDKCWTCPGGHLLQPWTAKTGVCDGCSRDVHAGDPVMDCRVCNFYLCNSCHPQEQNPGMDYFKWLTAGVSATISVVQEEAADLAQEVTDVFEAAASIVTCGAPPKTELEVSEADLRPPLAETCADDQDCTPTTAAGDRAEEANAEAEAESPAEREGAEDSAEEPGEGVRREPSDLIELPRDDLISFEPDAAPAGKTDIHQEVMAAIQARGPADEPQEMFPEGL